jgi:uncharacterized membrane protein YfcA
LTVEILLAAVAIAFLAAVCQSLTAFGFALVTVPLLALAWEVKPAVVTSTVLGTIVLLPLLYEVRGHVPVRRVTPILIGSLAGIPLGVLILERIDVIALEIVVAGVVIVGSLLIYFSPDLRVRRPPAPLSLAVGGLSGVLRAATSMGGPPVILYALTLERKVERFRATLLAVFLPTSIVTIAALAIAGHVTGDVLLVTVVAQPAVVLGSLTGRWARVRVSEPAFRLVVLGLLFASSGAVLASAAGSLS